MELVEKLSDFNSKFSGWSGSEDLRGYPFVVNSHAPFCPVHRSLPMSNLALISSAGAYIDGTDGFDITSRDGDSTVKELPVEIDAADLLYSAKGYDPKFVKEDRNTLIPIERLLGYESSAVIGSLNGAWYSISSWIPNAAVVAEKIAPVIVEKLKRQGVQIALFVPASRLCHQTLGIVARAVELAGISTIMISVDPKVTDNVRPPRVAHYKGEIGMTLGKPHDSQYHLRVLDEALRWTETFDQPTSRKLVVELETSMAHSRGWK